jgi:hypothetical protein
MIYIGKLSIDGLFVIGDDIQEQYSDLFYYPNNVFNSSEDSNVFYYPNKVLNCSEICDFNAQFSHRVVLQFFKLIWFLMYVKVPAIQGLF